MAWFCRPPICEYIHNLNNSIAVTTDGMVDAQSTSFCHILYDVQPPPNQLYDMFILLNILPVYHTPLDKSNPGAISQNCAWILEKIVTLGLKQISYII